MRRQYDDSETAKNLREIAVIVVGAVAAAIVLKLIGL